MTFVQLKRNLRIDVFLYKRGKGYKVKDLNGMEAKCRDPLPMHRQKSLGMNIETRRNKIMALLLLHAPSETSLTNWQRVTISVMRLL